MRPAARGAGGAEGDAGTGSVVRAALPGWDEYADAWSALHGGIDPRRARAAVRGWLYMGYTLAKACARIRVRPGAVTAFGFVTCLSTPVFAVAGGAWTLVAVVTVLIAAIADTVDGGLAVITSRTSRLGHVYDAIVDRIAEASWLYALWLIGVPGYAAVLAGGLSWLHEYARARANAAGMMALGATTLGERPTRVGLTILGIGMAGLVGVTSDALPAGIATFAVGVWIVLAVIGLAQLAATIYQTLAGRPWPSRAGATSGGSSSGAASGAFAYGGSGSRGSRGRGPAPNVPVSSEPVSSEPVSSESGARGPDARGSQARASKAAGSGAHGDGSRGSRARGSVPSGSDARGSGAAGSEARDDGSRRPQPRRDRERGSGVRGDVVRGDVVRGEGPRDAELSADGLRRAREAGARMRGGERDSAGAGGRTGADRRVDSDRRMGMGGRAGSGGGRLATGRSISGAMSWTADSWSDDDWIAAGAPDADLDVRPLNLGLDPRALAGRRVAPAYPRAPRSPAVAPDEADPDMADPDMADLDVAGPGVADEALLREISELDELPGASAIYTSAASDQGGDRTLDGVASPGGDGVERDGVERDGVADGDGVSRDQP